MLMKFLDALYGLWRRKLINVGTDGEPTMVGRLNGLVTRMAARQSITSCASSAHRTKWTLSSRTAPRCCTTASGPSRRGRCWSIYACRRT
ncbi:unnamed protein product [Sphagnum troendelagicum]|uniref:Uncharacterized protein n=1 Tax=Sphagnum troendelagicum TaxID=128251 RepID=A0ABP0UJD6_9BRYO